MNVNIEIVKSLAASISFLVLAAYLLTKLPLVKELMVNNGNKLEQKLFLIAIFGLIGIGSTYAGAPVEGAIANSRVIGVVAGGLIGGPAVGIGAGIIAGGHRFLIDIGGFTAVACAISTIVEGAIGGCFQKIYQSSRNNWGTAFAVTVAAEICQMLIILLIARPFEKALSLVEVIAVPMILFNSVGVAIFVGVFGSVFVSLDIEAARRTTIALEVANDCLPYMRRGLKDKESLDKTIQSILKIPGVKGAAISDREKVLSSGENRKLVSEMNMTSVSAPLSIGDEIVGSLALFVERYGVPRETERSLVNGMAKLFSTQLELSKIDEQAMMLDQAEFKALQAQINPHFLFNCLSTISAVCTEKPERARELLVLLGDYFRRTLQSGDYLISLQSEMEYVNAYLQLEQARFEERLKTVIEVPEELSCNVPTFILQPLVENAVKHGIMADGTGGTVSIRAQEEGGYTKITVSDNGAGMEKKLIEDLYAGRMDPKRIGLMNVHKRLLSMYGEQNGLKIRSTIGKGTEITLRIPNEQEEINANRSSG